MVPGILGALVVSIASPPVSLEEDDGNEDGWGEGWIIGIGVETGVATGEKEVRLVEEMLLEYPFTTPSSISSSAELLYFRPRREFNPALSLLDPRTLPVLFVNLCHPQSELGWFTSIPEDTCPER